MGFETKYTTLSIPLGTGENLGSGLGMIEVEPAERAFDSNSADLIKSAAYHQEQGSVVAPIALPDGRYVARIRTPGGRRITKLIDVISDGAGQRVDTVTTSQARVQGSNQFDPFDFWKVSRDNLLRLNELSSQLLGDTMAASQLHGDRADTGFFTSTMPSSLPSHPFQPARTMPAPEVGSGCRAYEIEGDANVTMRLGLAKCHQAGGMAATWARDHLVELLGLRSQVAPLALETVLGGSSVAELPAIAPTDSTQRYVAVRSDGESPRQYLVRLPGPWHTKADGMPLALQIAVTPGVDGGLCVQLRVPDKRIQAVLDFMQHTDLEAALSLIETSMDLLYFKHNNPYAAAAAGYVLLAAPLERTHDEYYRWIGNLGRSFPDLPDGCIQHATLLLQSRLPDHRHLPADDFPATQAQRCALAARLLLDSLNRGLPLYRSAFKLLVSNLRILEAEAGLQQETRSAISAAVHVVNNLRLRLDICQPFTVVDFSDVLGQRLGAS